MRLMRLLGREDERRRHRSSRRRRHPFALPRVISVSVIRVCKSEPSGDVVAALWCRVESSRVESSTRPQSSPAPCAGLKRSGPAHPGPAGKTVTPPRLQYAVRGLRSREAWDDAPRAAHSCSKGRERLTSCEATLTRNARLCNAEHTVTLAPRHLVRRRWR